MQVAWCGERAAAASRVCWIVALGLVSAALLFVQSGTARSTGAGQHHASGPSAPVAATKSHHKSHTQQMRHASGERARPRPKAMTHVARRGAAKPHQRAVSRAPTDLDKRPLIVIDPGHGGRDPGAIGVSGTMEKAVTLATALELRRSLEATGRYRVALTRTRDRTISLANRLAFAREHDADLLIAIHADSSPDRNARGASVYVSSGNTTTRLPANRGNSGRIANALSGSEPQREAGSAWLQYSMIEQLDDDVRMVTGPARNAHFYVLGARSIPSVLLEMGFLSNRKDESLIKQPAKRRVLAQAIRDAIEDYFAATQTPGPRT
jgi:N-acetylmuramoyl-L-alanine amidase